MVNFMDKMPDHFLGNFEIGDNAVSQGANGFDIAGGPAQHHFCFITNGQNLLLALVMKDRHNRWLIQYDTAALHINQRVRGSKVDGHIG